MKKKGFTLIELLVVIAIIGILSTIGLVALNGAREKARDAQRQSDLAQYRTALALYYDDNSFAYPDVDGGAAEGVVVNSDTVDSTGTTVPVAGTIFTSGGPLITTYLGAQLAPPSTFSLYYYDSNNGVTGANQAYLLYTQLEGGAQGYYWLDSEGGNGTPAAARVGNACGDVATCVY